MYKYHAVLPMTSNDRVVFEWIRSKIIRKNLTLTFHFVVRTSCYLLLILRGYTLMLGTTSDKQISRTFQGFAKDKLQFSRADIYSISRHSLTAAFWTSDQNHYDLVFRSVVENEDLYGWDYRLTNENHERYYLNRVFILETQLLWSKERWVMSSEDLKDWKEEVSIVDPECQMQRLKLSILAVTIKENWNQVGIDHVLYIK